MVQRLRLPAPNAGGPSLIPGQGTRSHMLQLKILWVTTKTWRSQKKFFLMQIEGFTGGSVVKNPPANAGDTDLICDPGKIPHALEQLRPCTTNIESML